MQWMMKYVLVSFVCFCFVSVRMFGRIGMYMLIATGDWRAGMTHGITYGYNAFPDPQVLWNHFDWVKAHGDKIWIATFVKWLLI